MFLLRWTQLLVLGSQDPSLNFITSSRVVREARAGPGSPHMAPWLLGMSACRISGSRAQGSISGSELRLECGDRDGLWTGGRCCLVSELFPDRSQLGDH